MAGPGRVRSAGCRRCCGLRGGHRRDLRNLRCPRDPGALAGLLTACSFPPSVPAGHPPACCLLALSLALPAFAAHAGSYVTANRRDSGEDEHVPRAAALMLSSTGSWRSYWRSGPCALWWQTSDRDAETQTPGDSRAMCLIVPELDFTVGPHVPLLLKE